MYYNLAGVLPSSHDEIEAAVAPAEAAIMSNIGQKPKLRLGFFVSTEHSFGMISRIKHSISGEWWKNFANQRENFFDLVFRLLSDV
jgi:hypothetical protein